MILYIKIEMSLSSSSNSENQFNLRSESNDEINLEIRGEDLDFNFHNQNILEHYQEPITENNHIYNEFYPHQNIEEENNYFDSTPKNTIDLEEKIEQTSVNNKKEEELSDFVNIPEEKENLSNDLSEIFFANNIHNNKEKKEKKKKKKKEKKKEKKEKKEEKVKKEDSKKNKNYLGKKRGRKSKSEKCDDDSKVHPGTELGNITRKMLTSFTSNAHYFIKDYINNKNLVQPTITAIYEKGKDKINRRLINSHENIRKLVHKTFYTFYHDYTFPKNVNGSKKIEDSVESEKNRQKWMNNHKKEIDKIIEEEKNKKIKSSTAILDLEFIQLLDVFLDYGYESYDNKKIEIDEKKYGFKFIDLQYFTTYKQICYEFSDDVNKQNYYRTHLKKIIHDQ